MNMEKLARWAYLRRRNPASLELQKLELELSREAPTAWPAPWYRREPASWRYRERVFPGRLGLFGLRRTT